MRECTSLRHLICGGEALPPSLAERFQQVLPHVHLHNLYGPTEATVACTGASESLHAAWSCRSCSRSLQAGLN